MDYAHYIEEANIKYELTNKINNLLIKNVENQIYNNNSNSITDEVEEHIKNEIEAEITKDKDLGKIYEENKNPIEYWIKQNIKKIHKEAINKFILIPKIKIEREEGET